LSKAIKYLDKALLVLTEVDKAGAKGDITAWSLFVPALLIVYESLFTRLGRADILLGVFVSVFLATQNAHKNGIE